MPNPATIDASAHFCASSLPLSERAGFFCPCHRLTRFHSKIKSWFKNLRTKTQEIQIEAGDEAVREDFPKLTALRKKYPKAALAIFWGSALVVVVFITATVRVFFAESFYVRKSSMEPTLSPADRVLVNKFSSKLSRGDIVIIKSQSSFSTGGTIIKRVIALSGETLHIDDCKVYINNQLLKEPYLFQKSYPECSNRISVERIVIPDGKIFVLGDNRQNSEDSRNFGSISKDAVIGRAALKFWPVWELGSL